MSNRTIASSKMTVFPDPVGAHTTNGLSEYSTCRARQKMNKRERTSWDDTMKEWGSRNQRAPNIVWQCWLAWQGCGRRETGQIYLHLWKLWTEQYWSTESFWRRNEMARLKIVKVKSHIVKAVYSIAWVPTRLSRRWGVGREWTEMSDGGCVHGSGCGGASSPLFWGAQPRKLEIFPIWCSILQFLLPCGKNRDKVGPWYYVFTVTRYNIVRRIRISVVDLSRIESPSQLGPCAEKIRRICVVNESYVALAWTLTTLRRSFGFNTSAVQL